MTSKERVYYLLWKQKIWKDRVQYLPRAEVIELRLVSTSAPFQFDVAERTVCEQRDKKSLIHLLEVMQTLGFTDEEYSFYRRGRRDNLCAVAIVFAKKDGNGVLI